MHPSLFGAAAVVLACPLASIADDWTLVHSTVSGEIYMAGTKPPVPASQMNAWIDALGLTDEQVEILRGIQADAENQFRFGLLEEREASADAQARGTVLQDWTATEQASARLGQAADVLRVTLTEDVTEQLRLIITPEQEALWPKLEQAERRSTILSSASAVHWFSLNLFTAVDASISDSGTRATLEPMLNAYADELDTVLVSLEREMDELAERVTEKEDAEKGVWARAEETGEPIDWEAVQAEGRRAESAVVDSAMRVHGLCERVGQINTRYLTQMKDAVPSEAGASMQAFADRLRPAPSRPTWYGQQDAFFNARSAQAFGSLLPEDPESEADESMTIFGGVSFSRMMDFQRSMMELARDEYPEIAEQWTSFMPVASADVTEDQKNDLRAIRSSFLDAKARIEQRFASTLRPAEADDRSNRLVVPAAGGAVYFARGAAAEDPWGKAGGKGGGKDGEDTDQLDRFREQMLELDQDTIDQIRDVLTPEQRLSILSF